MIGQINQTYHCMFKRYCKGNGYDPFRFIKNTEMPTFYIGSYNYMDSYSIECNNQSISFQDELSFQAIGRNEPVFVFQHLHQLGT